MDNWNSLVVSLWCGKYCMEENTGNTMLSYRTFGNHDIITVKPVDGTNSTDVLQNMWMHTNEISKNMVAGESIHNLFAISEDCDCNRFWETDLPYLFISAIQINFDCNKDFEEQLCELKNEIEAILCANSFKKNIDFIIYNSLDCGDILLFLKTSQYLLGADMIYEITIKSQIKHYSYSVCGFNTDLLFESILNNDEIIPKVVVCSVLADASNYESWFREFLKEYPRQLQNSIHKRFINSKQINDFINDDEDNYDEYVHFARLGNEDICINIYNCRMSHFLEMLCYDKGVFSHNNPLNKAAFSRLRIQFDSNINDIKPVKKRTFSEGKSLISIKSDLWKPILEKSANPYVYKAISEVFAASENLELKGFAFDIQDCIRNVLNLFINKISAYNNNKNKFSHMEFDNDLILFISGLMSIANGSLHADKLFINVPGFNAVPCDAPSKLLVYYTSYIQKLVSILNDINEFDYRFLLCPDLYIGIEVVTLFNYTRNESQLLKARIPIRKLFDPKTLLMELSHEAAHFVGAKIRNRRKRAGCLADIIAYNFSDRILRPIELQNLFPDDYISGDIEKNILTSFFPQTNDSGSLCELLKNEWKAIPEFIKEKLLKNCNLEDEKELFLGAIKELFVDNSIKLLVDNEVEELSNKIFEVLAENSEHFENVDDAFLLSKIIDRHINEILLGEYESIIHYACNLCSESFADLIMLYITEDPQTYLYNIFQSEKSASFSAGDEEIYSWNYYQIGQMKFERIISVLNTLNYNIEDINTDDELFTEFLNSLKHYVDLNNEDYRSCSIVTIEANSKYLSLCFNELKEKDKELVPLKNLYHSAAKSSLCECMSMFRKCAFDFRNSLIQENSLI